MSFDLQDDKKMWRYSKTIVLDMDETLLHTFNTNEIDEPGMRELILPRKGFEIRIGSERHWGMYRPGVREFLRFCSHFFDRVIIWSAGESTYVKSIINALYEGIPYPQEVLTRENCSKHSQGRYLYKPISQIGLSKNNTIFIDDLDDNFHSNPKNGIIIPVWDPETIDEGLKSEDNYLEKIMDWFDESSSAFDIRQVSRELVFSDVKPFIERFVEDV